MLRGLDIELPEGQIRAILGANGAGKSTLIKSILGLVHTQGGSILYDERIELRGLQPHEVSRVGVAWVPQGRLIFSTLTVYENLLMGAFNERNGKLIRDRVERMYGLFPILRDRQQQVAGSLSGGEQQMLTIARALMSNPRLLLMDEPSLGLAPRLIGEMFRLVREINSLGISVLVVEQNARQALEVASWAYVLEAGRVSAAGSPQDIEASDAIRKAYLGH